MRFADLTLAFLLAHNLLFTHVLGLSENVGTSTMSKVGVRSALLLGVFLVAGTMMTSLYVYVLVPYQLTVLSTLCLVICLGLANLAYSTARKALNTVGWPEPTEFLYHTLLVGGVLLVAQSSTDLADFLVIALAGVAGYTVGLVLLQAVFVRMARERLPVILQGLPFQLMTAGLVWLILSGLDVHLSGKAG